MIRKFLSRVTGAAARLPLPPFFRRSAYGAYARRYGVRLEETEFPLDRYKNFDSFFTRRLKPGARLVDSDPRALVSPVDGTVSACGDIEGESLFQAKGIDYPLRELLARDPRSAEFAGGKFLTVYLAPGDCHRMFAPLDLELKEAKRIGGTLRPVRTRSVETVPGLFCRNERVVEFWSTPLGSAAFVIVGALNVGSIELLKKPGDRARKGEEIAVFHLGSTVILLLPRGRVNWDGLRSGDSVQIGKRIGTLTAS